MRKAYILIISFSMLLACNDSKPTPQHYTYRIISEVNQGVELSTYYHPNAMVSRTFIIEAEGIYQEDSTVAWPLEYELYDFLRGDSAVLIFEDGKALTYTCLSSDSTCLDANNLFGFFNPVVTSEEDLTEIDYQYTITQADYERAQ